MVLIRKRLNFKEEPTNKYNFILGRFTDSFLHVKTNVLTESMRIPTSYVRKVRLESLEGQKIDNIEYKEPSHGFRMCCSHIFLLKSMGLTCNFIT